MPFRLRMISLSGGFNMNDDMSDAHYMSQARLDELKQELHDRKTTVRKEVAASLEYAKSLGDLSENFEYHDAKDRQSDNEKRVIELEGLIENAVVISKQSGTGTVNLGVTFVAEREGKETEYQIVGSNEANPMERKISNESPMGQAFIGAKVGQEVSVQTPSGAVTYRVVSIV